MSKLEPIDNGVRRYRPGLIVLLSIPLLLIAAWFIVNKVRENPPSQPKTTTTAEIQKIREAPKPPSPHPLAGKRRIFLADGCRHRYQEFTFTRFYSTQHDHPGIVIRNNDPTLWKFDPVTEKAHVYRIYCADPNFPELHDHNLTYTRLVDDGDYLNDEPPYLTLRRDDPCEWKIHYFNENSHKDQYEIFCVSGADPFIGKSLGWMTGQDDLQKDDLTATLGENGRPAWWILPEGEAPEIPRRASHLLVMNKGDIPDLPDARKHFEEKGHAIFRVQFETEDDEFTRSAQNLDYVALVKSLRDFDPVIAHPDFPSLLSAKLEEILKGTALPGRADPLFPLIIPLKVAVHAHDIRELTLENTAFWFNEWESLEDFQSHLDESDAADGRVYHGEKFTYIFVSWDP